MGNEYANRIILSIKRVFVATFPPLVSIAAKQWIAAVSFEKNQDMDIQEILLQVKGLTPGRVAALVPGLLGLIGIILAAIALLRASIGSSTRRLLAIIALVLALIDILFSGLHLARTTGGFGTGSGRLGAIVAMVVGFTGIYLAWRAWHRSTRLKISATKE
jgi:hypothetical protein